MLGAFKFARPNSRYFVLWRIDLLRVYGLNSKVLIFWFEILKFFICLFVLWWKILFVLFRNLHLIWSMIQTLILWRGRFFFLALFFFTKLIWLSLSRFAICLMKRTSKSIVKFNFRLAIDKDFLGRNWNDFSDLGSDFSFLWGT